MTETKKEQPEDAVERNRQAILASPSYRLAELDADFIGRPEQRPVRMQLELDKAETVLREAGIRSTVVVFGGTQIVPREVAETRLADAEARLKKNSQLPQARRDVQRAKSCLAKSHFYDEARQFARLASEYCQRGEKCDLVVMTGGGPGIMEAANRGAKDVNGHSIGCNIELPMEQQPNPYLDKFIEFRYFFVRKVMLVKYSYAFVVLPGGFGTLDELFEALTLIQTGKIRDFPVVLMGSEYWEPMLAFFRERLIEQKTINASDLNLLMVTDSPEQAVDYIAERAVKKFGFSWKRPPRRWWLGE